MADGLRTRGVNGEEDDVVVLEGNDTGENRALPLCLIGKVAIGKPFNAFGFLEAMKRAMNPSKGFTTSEIGPNLFSFQFQRYADLEEVKRHEPWHFERNIVLFHEIGEGEQPSAVTFTKTGMWVRMYDLPIAVRSEKHLISIASRCGEVVEIDRNSTMGFGRSIQVKLLLDITKPLKTAPLRRLDESVAIEKGLGDHDTKQQKESYLTAPSSVVRKTESGAH
ncbi:hypothetical protein ACS0TY_018753 [Phlomoides rotata]